MRRARYAVAKASEIVPNTATVVRLGNDADCALFRHNGAWYATGSLCPHQNTPLDGAPAIGGYGLPVYSVDVEDDTVYVSVWEFD